MKQTIVNLEEIPDDLPAGTYCCRLESITWLEMKIRWLNQIHVPGSDCCLIQLVKADPEVQVNVSTSVVPPS